MSADKPLPPELLPFAHALARHLGVGVELDLNEILGLAGVAAHKVARPAAPVTTFLLGCAAAESPHVRFDLLRERVQRFVDAWDGPDAELPGPAAAAAKEPGADAPSDGSSNDR